MIESPSAETPDVSAEGLFGFRLLLLTSPPPEFILPDKESEHISFSITSSHTAGGMTLRRAVAV
jgi:hypothetical protein